MSDKELWTYCWERKVFHTKPFDRDFIWVHARDFEPLEKYFVPEYNIFHGWGKSMRTRSLLRHIQAVKQGDYVFLHKDTGNVARFLPLGIIHLFADVLPYVLKYERIHARRTGAPRKSLYHYAHQMRSNDDSFALPE